MTAYPVNMFSLPRYRITPVLVSLLLLIPTVMFAQDTSVSAYEFVQEWIKTYGVDHKRSAAMMTERHRGGMSEVEWVAAYAGYIEYIKYKHLGGELISTQEEARKARVILKSSVDSIKGPVVQHEIYDLLKVNGGWLVDFINIQDENFDTAIGPEPAQQFDSKNKKPSP